jgi:hypothetical protein
VSNARRRGRRRREVELTLVGDSGSTTRSLKGGLLQLDHAPLEQLEHREEAHDDPSRPRFQREVAQRIALSREERQHGLDRAA